MRHNIFSDVLNKYVFRILFIITQNVYLYTPVFSNVHSISPYFPVFSPRITTFISCSQLYFNYLHKLPALHWSSHRKCSIEICVLENFIKFTGKHLCQSLFFNKVAGLSPTNNFTENDSTEHLPTTVSDYKNHLECYMLFWCMHVFMFCQKVIKHFFVLICHQHFSIGGHGYI